MKKFWFTIATAIHHKETVNVKVIIREVKRIQIFFYPFQSSTINSNKSLCMEIVDTTQAQRKKRRKRKRELRLLNHRKKGNFNSRKSMKLQQSDFEQLC